MRVHPVPIGDNYAYVVEGQGKEAIVVDPGEAAPVLAALDDLGLRPVGVLVTHHHGDHAAGAPAVAARVAGIPVVRSPGRLSLAGCEVLGIATPGHTRDHVVFVVGGTDVFTGDLLFGLTIGNLFEGTPDVMFASLRKVAALPPETRLWPGHEYTRMGAEEAIRVDPDNPALVARVASLRASSGPTIPLSLRDELATNPYLRCRDAEAFRRLCEET